MKWRGRKGGGRIEDRRGTGGGGGLGGGMPIPLPMGKAGGGGMGLILLVVVFLLLRSCGGAEGFEALKNTWGIVEEEAGRHGKTVDRSGWRLVSFFHIADSEQQARAHAGLGDAHLALGNLTQARHHYQHALTRYIDLGTPEADQIRTCLTTIDDTSSAQRSRTPTVAFTEGPCGENNR